MSARAVTLASIFAALLTQPALAQDAQKLLNDYKCYICHADHEWKAGPAYDAVAAAYKRRPHAVDELIAVIRKGQHGAGPWQMPPHPEVSNAKARVMARYILSLSPVPSPAR